MKTDFHVHFYIRKEKINKIGIAPIYLRLVVKGKRVEYSISRRVKPMFWSATSEKVMGNNREAKEINDHIANLRHKLNKVHQTLIDNDIEVTAKDLMYKLRGGSRRKSKLLLEVFKEHNEKMDILAGKDITVSTATRYWTCYRHLQSFIKSEYNTTDYPLRKIDNQFITKLEYYLKTTRKCNHNSTLKYINNFKKIVRIACIY